MPAGRIVVEPDRGARSSNAAAAAAALSRAAAVAAVINIIYMYIYRHLLLLQLQLTIYIYIYIYRYLLLLPHHALLRLLQHPRLRPALAHHAALPGLGSETSLSPLPPPALPPSLSLSPSLFLSSHTHMLSCGDSDKGQPNILASSQFLLRGGSRDEIRSMNQRTFAIYIYIMHIIIYSDIIMCKYV